MSGGVVLHGVVANLVDKLKYDSTHTLMLPNTLCHVLYRPLVYTDLMENINVI